MLILFGLHGMCEARISYSRNIAKGIDYYRVEKDSGSSAPKVIHVLVVDLSQPSVEVMAALARDRVGCLRSVSNIARTNGAIAGVNGSFFDRSCPYLPVGLLVRDGEIMTKSLLNRSAVGFSGKNTVRFGIPKFTGKIINSSAREKFDIWGINRPRKDNEIIIYTPEYGYSTKTNDTGVEIIIEDDIVVGISTGNSPIPQDGYVISFHGWTKDYANTIPPGTTIEAEYSLAGEWKDFNQVITGGPRLIDNGKIVVDKSLISENIESDLTQKNARTAVGVTADNKLMLVVVEGGIRRYTTYYRRGKKRRRRHHYVRYGMTYGELARTMKTFTAVNAIGLDGGGSCTMYVDGAVVNKPAEGCVQGVSDAIIVKIKH